MARRSSIWPILIKRYPLRTASANAARTTEELTQNSRKNEAGGDTIAVKQQLKALPSSNSRH
jgi:hypothetical protein